MKEFYTAKELIEHSSLSKNTIYKYLDEGKIKSVRVGKGKYRVPRKEAEKFFTRGTSKQTSQVSKTPVRRVVGFEEVFRLLGRLVSYRVGRVLGAVDGIKYLPGLFDWFVGMSAILSGVGLWLYPRYFYRETFMASVPVMLGLGVVLFILGFWYLAFVLSSRGGGGAKKMLLVMVLAFFTLAGMLWSGAQVEGAILFGSIAAVVTASLVLKHVQGVLKFVLLVFLVGTLNGLMWFAYPVLYNPTYSGVVSAKILAGGWLAVSSLIFVLSVIAIKERKSWYGLLSFVNSVIFLGLSFFSFVSGAWEVAAGYVLLTAFSILFPFWKSFEVGVGRGVGRRVRAAAYVGGVLVLGLVVIRLAQSGFEQFVGVSLERRAEAAAAEVESFLSEAEIEVVALADSRFTGKALEDMDWNSLALLSQDAYNASSQLSRVAVFDTSGSVVSVYPHDTGVVSDGSAEYEEYFDQAAKGETVFSGLVEADGGRAWRVVVMAPSYSSDGELVGAVMGLVDLAQLNAQVGLAGVGGGLVAVVDESGRLAVHPDDNLKFSVSEQTREISTRAQVDGAGVWERVDGQAGKRDLMLAAAAEVGEFSWAVLVAEPLADVGVLVSGVALLVLVVLMAVVIGLVLVFRRRDGEGLWGSNEGKSK